jgi:hypothetical protein
MTAKEKARSFTDPALFSHTWLNRRLWQKQKEILWSVANNPLTAVKGCHASGKTYASAGLPLWWVTRYGEAKAMNTAPTLRQVKLFWSEVAVAHRQSNLRSLLPVPSTLGLHVGPDRYAQGASSSLGVNIQGYHSPNMLIVADEAPGIGADIWDAIEGVRAGGNVRMLILGNPVIPTGYFHDAFHRGRNIWHCFSISAFDTPNLQHEVTGEPLTIEDLMTMDADRLAFCPFPALITRAWVRERYLVWGPNHPKFLSRVMAQFPTQAENAVFSLEWIEKAKRDPTELELQKARNQMIQVGIDVAGAGSDETVLTARVGGIIIAKHVWQDSDPRGSVLRVLGILRAHPLYRLGVVVVDIVGIGYNFALHISDHGFNVYGFNAGSRPIDTAQFTNQKAEITWQAREWFKAGLISGLGILSREDGITTTEEETEAQLSTMLYRETSRGLTEIVPKEEMKKKFNVPSPDRAESLIMAFMRVVPREQSTVLTGDYQISAI